MPKIALNIVILISVLLILTIGIPVFFLGWTLFCAITPLIHNNYQYQNPEYPEE